MEVEVTNDEDANPSEGTLKPVKKKALKKKARFASGSSSRTKFRRYSGTDDKENMGGLVYACIYSNNGLESNSEEVCPTEVFKNQEDIRYNIANDTTGPLRLRNVGILAGNMYAKGIIKILLKNVKRLFIWSADAPLQLEKEIKSYGKNFKICMTQTEVVRKSDIIFGCLLNQNEVKTTMVKLGLENIDDDFLCNKGYIEMTNIDGEKSIYWRDLMHKKGATYLNALVLGSEKDGSEGKLLVLLTGDKTLSGETLPVFNFMGKVVCFEEIDLAIKSYTILRSLQALFVAAVAEGYAYADRDTALPLKDFHNIFELTPMSNKYLLNKGIMMMKEQFDESKDLNLQQYRKELEKTLEMSDKYPISMPLTSCVNQILKQTCRLGHGLENQDLAAIYTRIRH